MANEEHLAILKQGVEVWNAWRDDNPDIQPYLFGVCLSDANLTEANLSGANLRACMERGYNGLKTDEINVPQSLSH